MHVFGAWACTETTHAATRRTCHPLSWIYDNKPMHESGIAAQISARDHARYPEVMNEDEMMQEKSQDSSPIKTLCSAHGLFSRPLAGRPFFYFKSCHLIIWKVSCGWGHQKEAGNRRAGGIIGTTRPYWLNADAYVSPLDLMLTASFHQPGDPSGQHREIN